MIWRQARLAIEAGRYLGWQWVFFRGRYALQQRLGLLERKTPARPWEAIPPSSWLRDPSLATAEAFARDWREHAPPFFFHPQQRMAYRSRLAAWSGGPHDPVSLAENIARGHFLYFSHTLQKVGFPPDWHKNPWTGQRFPTERHWSRVSDFGHGDIKVVWELSRFGFVYPLVRAYWRTGDERYPELFWRLVEDWRAQNPPNLGPNWKCGQETTFRVMAWIFGLYGFADAASTTPERVLMLAQMLAVSGERIAANLDYALSQQNNHGVSEGVGLWTLGLLFPQFRQAAAWRKRGRGVLERLGQELIYEDGSFVQHSVNYHRLMLHDYLWAMRLGQLHGRPLSSALYRRVAQAGRWLYALLDASTGQVPLYGQNDGALILPLSNSDYLDFRPVVQAVYVLTSGRRVLAEGPWDEALLWLFGPEALQAPLQPETQGNLQARIGGYHTLRSAQGFLFTRCATFRHRPGQADMLHVDLWWQGQNIALDAGTYSYNAPPPWHNALARTRYHNTVTVDERDQMERVGPFLWLPWLRAQVRKEVSSPRGEIQYWEGDHDGYHRLQYPATHRRAIVQFPGEGWLVIDDLNSQAAHAYRLHWLLADYPFHGPHPQQGLRLDTPKGPYWVLIQADQPVELALTRASSEGPEGWRAPYYQTRRPALALSAVAQHASVRFLTLFAPAPLRMHREGEAWHLHWGAYEAHLFLASQSASPLVRSVQWTHPDGSDLWEIP